MVNLLSQWLKASFMFVFVVPYSVRKSAWITFLFRWFLMVLLALIVLFLSGFGLHRCRALRG